MSLYENYETLKKQFPQIVEPIPDYIISNLRYPLYDWQKSALENFLLNEKSRAQNKITSPNHLMFNMATGSGKTLLMAALILYYYKQGYRNFIFFVNQRNIVGKTQGNFIQKNHPKYLFKEQIAIDGRGVRIKEVEQFSLHSDDIQIKFTTIHKLHNAIYKDSENDLLLSDLQKRDLVLIGDEAHHLNSSSKKLDAQPAVSDDISFLGELKDGSKDEDIEKSWETTVIHYILNKGMNLRHHELVSGFNREMPKQVRHDNLKVRHDNLKVQYDNVGLRHEGHNLHDGVFQNKNVLLEFTATIPNDEAVQKKYEDKLIAKFNLSDFVRAGCTKEINLVSSNGDKKQRVLQSLLFNWYRSRIALDANIPNFKPVILFRSKTIEESNADMDWFFSLVKNLKNDDFDFLTSIKQVESGGAAYMNGVSRLYRVNAFIKENKIPLSEIIDFIQANFTEKTCVITNSKTNKTKKEKTDADLDIQLNSLESPQNHIRAIFTVDRLTEGWDVLNLYDIVRLYTGRDTNFKAKGGAKAGSSTTSEIQLIGRGVRYYPFTYKGMSESQNKYRRKFDNDTENILRPLEEFYFHSDNDEKYISELTQELKAKGFVSDNRIEKRFKFKKDFADKAKGLLLFKNEKIENPERKLKTIPQDLLNEPPFEFDANIENIYIEQKVSFSGEDDKVLSVASSNGQKTLFVKFSDFDRHIKYAALRSVNRNYASYFRFESLKEKLNVNSTEDFFKMIGGMKINITAASDTDFSDDSENPLPNKKKLECLENFFLFRESELQSYDKPYTGSSFVLKDFAECFPEEKQNAPRLINANENEKNANDATEKSVKNYTWYAVDSFWGTSEERNLVEFIKNHIGNLQEKYADVKLLRNEEVYTIYDKEGRGFQPDFLLLLQNKNQKQLLQVFIEPKGSHLVEKDAWKNEFLEQIAADYGLKKIVVKEFPEYRLVGLPFYNSATDGKNESVEIKAKFEEAFEKLV